MRGVKSISFDPIKALFVVLVLALGFTEQVDWWIVILFLLAQVKLKFTWDLN